MKAAELFVGKGYMVVGNEKGHRGGTGNNETSGTITRNADSANRFNIYVSFPLSEINTLPNGIDTRFLVVSNGEDLFLVESEGGVKIYTAGKSRTGRMAYNKYGLSEEFIPNAYKQYLLKNKSLKVRAIPEVVKECSNEKIYRIISIVI